MSDKFRLANRRRSGIRAANFYWLIYFQVVNVEAVSENKLRIMYRCIGGHGIRSGS